MLTNKSVLGLAVIVAALAGCSSTPVVQPAPQPKPVAQAPAQAPQAPAQAAPVPAPVALPAYLDPASPIYTNRSVYFDFDQFVIRDDAKPVVESHGQYLAQHPQLSVKVEGNADERGSAEYNLALGQRRADTVVKALVLMGAHKEQLEAVSWGKEKPKALGHDESAWSQNRRADLVYPSH